MSTLKSNVIEPATGTNLSLGAGGDLIDVPSDALQLNTWKDSGGNTLFTSDGSGIISSVNSALTGGGPTLISTQTASGAATLEFTSGIDSTYDKYMFVYLDINPATNDVSFGFHTSIDGGSSYGIAKTTTAWNVYHDEADTASGYQYASSFDLDQGTGIQYITMSQGNGADESAAGILYLFAPSSTTYVKQFYSRAESNHQADYAQDVFIGGYVNTTSAINAIQFKFNSGNFDGTVKMYGCR